MRDTACPYVRYVLTEWGSNPGVEATPDFSEFSLGNDSTNSTLIAMHVLYSLYTAPYTREVYVVAFGNPIRSGRTETTLLACTLSLRYNPAPSLPLIFHTQACDSLSVKKNRVQASRFAAVTQFDWSPVLAVTSLSRYYVTSSRQRGHRRHPGSVALCVA